MVPTGDDETHRPVDARGVRTRNDILRTALQVLVEQGREAVTPPNLAQAAGYSRATVYKHWPTRTDLLRDAFRRLGDIPHHEPTGELRADLIGELAMYRAGMRDHRLDRTLAALADMTATTPEMVELRDKLVSDGEQVIRELLARETAAPQAERDAVMLMLCGGMLYAALMHDQLPGEDLIAAMVDLCLRGLGQGEPVTP